MPNGTAILRGRERRRSPRLTAPFPVTVRGTEPGGKRFQHVTRLDDISHDGLHVMLPVSLNVGARMFAVVRMAESESAPAARLAVRGVVVRAAGRSDGRVGLGVRFACWRFL
jgi:PilZ domain